MQKSVYKNKVCDYTYMVGEIMPTGSNLLIFDFDRFYWFNAGSIDLTPVFEKSGFMGNMDRLPGRFTSLLIESLDPVLITLLRLC